MGLGTWKNSEHRLHIVSKTWKNSMLELPPGLWHLEKFQALPLDRLIQALGFEKNFELPLPSITAGWRREVRGVTLLSPSFKL